MKQFLLRHRAIIASFIALCLPLFLIHVHGKRHDDPTFIETGLMWVTAPAQRAVGSVVSAAVAVWDGYIALVDLKATNQELVRRIAELEGKALENQQLREENARLAAISGFIRLRPDLVTVPGRIVAKDVSPYYRIVRAVVQTPEGTALRPNMPVVSHRGVVGRVSQVDGAYASIMLTVDAHSRIDATILGKGVSGTLEGRGDRNSYGARFLFLHRGEPIEEGDLVVTSGHDAVFPAGIPVGRVASTEERQSGVHFEYDIIPVVNFATLEHVLVVLSDRPEVPSFGRRP